MTLNLDSGSTSHIFCCPPFTSFFLRLLRPTCLPCFDVQAFFFRLVRAFRVSVFRYLLFSACTLVRSLLGAWPFSLVILSSFRCFLVQWFFFFSLFLCLDSAQFSTWCFFFSSYFFCLEFFFFFFFYFFCLELNSSILFLINVNNK